MFSFKRELPMSGIMDQTGLMVALGIIAALIFVMLVLAIAAMWESL